MRYTQRKQVLSYIFFISTITLIAFCASIFNAWPNGDFKFLEFVIYLFSLMGGFAGLFFLVNHIFRSKKILNFTYILSRKYKLNKLCLLIIRSISCAIIFGFLFFLVQLVISFFNVKANYPYLILDSILMGVAGGLCFIYLLSIINPDHHTITYTFFVGFFSFFCGNYLAERIYFISMYYDVFDYSRTLWKLIDNIQWLFPGILIGISFTFLIDKYRWIFPLILISIFGLHSTQILALPIDHLSAKLFESIYPNDVSLGFLMGKQMHYSFLIGRIINGTNLGLLFGLIVHLLSQDNSYLTPAPPDKPIAPDF